MDSSATGQHHIINAPVPAQLKTNYSLVMPTATFHKLYITLDYTSEDTTQKHSRRERAGGRVLRERRWLFKNPFKSPRWVGLCARNN